MEKVFEFTLPLGTVIVGAEIPNSNGEHYQYHVESVLGQGGFGITYKVWAIVKNGRIRAKMPFAIKEHFVKGRCHRAKDNVTVEYSREAAQDVEESLKDFIKEGRLLSSICQVNDTKSAKNRGYQNIVPVNEVIETNNTAYFVMQFLDGGSLRDMILNGKSVMTEEKALSLMLPICQAVSYIHRNGILHMDIKPENIVMRRNLETTHEEPVLIDFGVSLHFDKKGQLTTTHTSFGRTEGFSPIEQYGNIETFQPKIDVYALGATFFYLLSGKIPPSAFNVTPDYLEKNLPQNISSRTRKAIIHAMAKDALYRTPSANDFISELENRYTLPIGNIINSPHTKYLITSINDIQPNYIRYDAVLYTGSKRNQTDVNITQRHSYYIYEYFVKGNSVRNEDESVTIKDKIQFHQFMETIMSLSGLKELGDAEFLDTRVEREIFNANGTTYVAVDKRFKPTPEIIKKFEDITSALKKHTKAIVKGIALVAVIGGVLVLMPAIIKSFQKTDEDRAKEITEAIKNKDIEVLENYAQKDSVRAILPLADLYLENGDRENARVYAELVFSKELFADTAAARNILNRIEQQLKLELEKDSLEKMKNDSILNARKEQENNVENAKQEELRKKEEEKRQEEKRKEQEKQKQENAAKQKIAEQADAAQKALNYSKSGKYEDQQKAYQWAQKADEKTKQEVFKRLRAYGYPGL